MWCLAAKDEQVIDMSAKYLVGFIAVAGLAVAGLDYYQKAKASGDGLSASDYIAAFTGGVEDAPASVDSTPEAQEPEAAEPPGKLVCKTVGNTKRCRSEG